jgi:hypothetical protein
MSRFNSKAGTQRFTFDGADAGEGLAVFLSQTGDATNRYRFLVEAMIGEGVYDVGTFYSSPPTATAIPGKLSRMIAAAICPGATSWAVTVAPVKGVEDFASEDAEVILASSRCFTSPVGIDRVSERYAYHANSGTQNFTVLAGMTVTSIGAVGIGGGGTVIIDGGDTISIPTGIGVNLEPKSPIRPNSVIAFNSVDWAIEYLESA